MGVPRSQQANNSSKLGQKAVTAAGPASVAEMLHTKSRWARRRSSGEAAKGRLHRIRSHFRAWRQLMDRRGNRVRLGRVQSCKSSHSAWIFRSQAISKQGSAGFALEPFTGKAGGKIAPFSGSENTVASRQPPTAFPEQEPFPIFPPPQAVQGVCRSSLGMFPPSTGRGIEHTLW